MHGWTAIFFAMIRISIFEQHTKCIAILWYYDSSSTFRNYCLWWLLTLIQALLYLFIKQRDKKVPSLLYKASRASNPTNIFQDGGTNTCLNCQCVIYYHALLRMEINDFKAVKSAVHNDVWYRVSYHGTCIKMCIVSWENVLLQP